MERTHPCRLCSPGSSKSFPFSIFPFENRFRTRVFDPRRCRVERNVERDGFPFEREGKGHEPTTSLADVDEDGGSTHARTRLRRVPWTNGAIQIDGGRELRKPQVRRRDGTEGRSDGDTTRSKTWADRRHAEPGMILASEVGDKTFLMAAVMAMRQPRSKVKTKRAKTAKEDVQDDG